MSIFNKGSEHYQSDIKLGEEYREKSTGLVGKAIAISFFEHACERTPVQQKTGGPAREAGTVRRGAATR